MIVSLTTLVFLCATANALQAVPFLFASHRLVRGLKDEVLQPNTRPQAPALVTNLVKKAVTECSSDVYVLLNVPGLQNTDLLSKRKAEWRHLQNYLHMASSVVGLPWVDGTLDLGFLEEYIVRTCKAESVRSFHSDEHVGEYIDTRKRVIRVEANALPGPGPERLAALADVDDLVRKILRKAPSPHYTLVVTSDEVAPVHPVPELAVAADPARFELFHDVVNDPRRAEERERNSHMYRDVEPFWNEGPGPAELYTQRKKQDEVHLLDPELWRKHEKLVMTVVLMVASVAFMQTLSFGRWLREKLVSPKQKRM
ncbi:BIG1-domain-containing protein [Metschnikowia bicuspidata var. bicuspidata NRRL YB-4993]|uniref:Protein BIG1 n=1 Tax=Metschnikowia bicuspidata var. bicuspidata NRRL YB-4993 TaxID=869754 RepID=A0A1A0H686_9ASCO|nr:BIG1-domain-containing protein [Metschnikowia bicuspidata var. bicuspidata NRRL YB-4993]OBA19599.1 BIG1-domain-containing protein [Metschnikowia bicuspidata var. bicuspidata NRRL YB-4993]